ncbi:MAG: CTP synthase [Puniceicoccales bacterium]|jgi:CTP synthase|nr:CTP synthase [Puniceicoccales bacterium]
MKYIFITGGVVSSLGKGLTAGALGALLEAHGYGVILQKFDPYLNVDPGTMSPFQHGEVYVLDDGAETDLDLGHYERFTHSKLTRNNSISSGKIYSSVIKRERQGDYLGKTVQVIPHVTDEIKACFRAGAGSCDVVITEIGGTVGDIESLPFLESMRQLALEEGKANVLFIHMTLVPYLRAAGEIKSKPSQQSVAKLREIGVQPDVLVCRTEVHLPRDIRQKLSMFCNVEERSVIEEKDLELSIYELPGALHMEGLDSIVLSKLNLPNTPCDMSPWDNVIKRLKNPERGLKIGLIGKYNDLPDAYKSVNEALIHGGIANNCAVNVIAVDSEDIEKNGTARLEEFDGILVPGGFGNRGIEGKIAAAKYAREKDVPYFGICLGMQTAAIEFARNVAEISDANSEEFCTNGSHVICMIDFQKTVAEKGGTMRLGAYDCRLTEGSLAGKAYGAEVVRERHRHRYELNPIFESALIDNGLLISGRNPDTGLVEIIENPALTWFVAVQFHPEFLSKPMKPHPLFADFVKAAKKNKRY